MSGVKKLVGVFALAAFILAAGSVICFASGQPSVMVDCGNQTNGAALCPFMSPSIPTIPAVILMFVLVFAVITAVSQNDRHVTAALSQYQDGGERPPASFLNSTLRLISEGILHPRVFGL